MIEMSQQQCAAIGSVYEHRGTGPVKVDETGGGAVIARRLRSSKNTGREYTFLVEPDGTTSRVRASGKVEAYFHPTTT